MRDSLPLAALVAKSSQEFLASIPPGIPSGESFCILTISQGMAGGPDNSQGSRRVIDSLSLLMMRTLVAVLMLMLMVVALAAVVHGDMNSLVGVRGRDFVVLGADRGFFRSIVTMGSAYDKVGGRATAPLECCAY